MIDRPLLLGRTGREYLLIALGVGAIVHDLLYCSDASVAGWNIAGYSVAILSLVVRFYAARALGVGWCVSAIILQLTSLQLPGMSLVDLPWIALMPVAILALLASRDLVDRYDLAPSRIRWLRNYWAEVPRSFARRAAWVGYLLGSLGAMLLYAYLQSRALRMAETWALLACLGCLGAVLLLVAGRAFGFFLAAAIGIGTALAVWPQIGPARAVLAAGGWHRMSGLFVAAPQYALPVFAMGIAIALIAAPYVVRLLVHTTTARR